MKQIEVVAAIIRKEDKIFATYWNVGKRIVEEEQNGEKRAAYGIGLMKSLSESLIPVYGRSYSKRNLDYYKKFYLLFPDPEKVNTVFTILNGLISVVFCR